MANKSRKRVGRYEKDQSGCIGSLINIFDFRQGRSSQKLILDKKPGSKRIVGAAYPDNKLESLSNACEICKDLNDSVHSGMSTFDASKMSVKELMEEEMCGEQDQKRHEIIANGDGKQTTATGDGGHGKKNRRRTRSKTSLDLDAHGFVGLVTEKPSHRKHKSLSSVDLSVVVEEFCSRIPPKDTVFTKHQSTEDPSVLEEKLWEATKMLVNHFTEGKNFPKYGKVQPSRELVDALQILDSNKEVFLKFLQDPNSQLVKHVQSLEDIQVEEGKFQVLTGSNLLEQDLGNGKQKSFFWRRFKGLERNRSRKNESCEDLSRIVVLKPGPLGSRNLDMATPCSSLPGSPQSVGQNGQIERVSSSTFSFSELKRILKHAMRKEQNGVVHNGMSHQPVVEQPNPGNPDKRFGGETAGMASPSRDHFFLEKIPKSSVAVKKGDKSGKPKDSKVHLEHVSALPPEQRVSSIYAEAKKHLAEIVGNVDVDMGTPGRRVPKSLGRLLSYSGYNSPTLCSPRKHGEMRLSLDGECHVVEENRVSIPDQVKLEIESKPIHGGEASTFEPHISDGLPCEDSVDKPTHESEVPPATEVDVDIVRSLDAESKEESNLMENFSEPCLLQPICSNERVDSSLYSRCSEENGHSTSLRQDTYDRNQSSSSSIASTLIYSMAEKNEDLYTMSDATSRPSPISVLEPIFKEDDISPPATKSSKVFSQPIQPRQIHFEEEFSPASERVFCNRTCTEGDKYTFEFVKAVIQMSGLSWDELLRRSFFSDHLIDPSIIDEVDFLPDLLSCDFKLLFDLINKVVVEISWLNFSFMLLLAEAFVKPELKGKDLFNEIWNAVDWYLKLEKGPHTLDEIVAKDLAKVGSWMDLGPHSESIGIQVQEAILEDLMEDTVLSCHWESRKRLSRHLKQRTRAKAEFGWRENVM